MSSFRGVHYTAVYRLFPATEKAGITTISAIIAGFLAIVSDHFFRDLNDRLKAKLKIGERIAPYFGHKIAKTLHVIRG